MSPRNQPKQGSVTDSKLILKQEQVDTVMEDFGFDWVDRLTAQRLLGIKEAQLRNDTAILCQLETPGFDYKRYSDRGFGKSTFQALVEFRRLVKLKGRARAIAEINTTMEALHCNERKRQASC